MDKIKAVAHSRATGKWAQAGVPHKGWVSTEEDVEYVGPDSETCEMCEVTEIRWVHHVSHPDYPEELRVGCICAGHMTGDYEQPKQRERLARNAARREKTAKKRRENAAAKEKARAEQALVNQALAEIATEKRREQALVNLANRRAAWPTRVWPLSAKGNETILEDGFQLTVFKDKRGRWSGSYKQPGSDTIRYLKGIHDNTREAAKLALFDDMIFLQKKKVK